MKANGRKNSHLKAIPWRRIRGKVIHPFALGGGACSQPNSAHTTYPAATPKRIPARRVQGWPTACAATTAAMTQAAIAAPAHEGAPGPGGATIPHIASG